MRSFDFWSANITGGGLLLARPDRPHRFILNHTAAFLWTALQSATPPENLASLFADQFAIPLAQAASDISATLESWSHSLLAPASPVAPAEIPRDPPSTPATFFDFSLGASSFRLTSADPDFLDEIHPRLAHLLSPSSSSSSLLPPNHLLQVSAPSFSVWRNGVYLETCEDAAAARVLILLEIGRLAQQPVPDWLCVLHAATLAHPLTHHAVLLAAPTGAGKSTLAAALSRSGLRLLYDDAAAITATTQQAVAMPFALMLRSGSWPVLSPHIPEIAILPTLIRYGQPVRFLPPPSLDPAPATPKHLVFVRYQPGLATRLEPLSHLETFYRLEASGLWVHHTQQAITAFAEWLQSIPSYELQYSDLSEAIAYIHNLLGPAPQSW